MALGERIRASSPTTRILFVALFAFLLVFGTTVQLLHFHADGNGHADCALCQNAHSAIRPTSAPRVQTVSLVIRRVAPPSTRLYREHLFSYSHWNRPPPDLAAIA
jgi:hypothetical protein